MTKKFLFNWAIWIGVASGIYCYIYAMLPLPTQSLMWMSFVALPIYFNGGAKLEEYHHYIVSAITGVGWSLIYIYFIGVFLKVGISVPLTLFAVVGGVTIACVAFHLIITGNTWFNKLAMMYGGISTTFSQNGDNLLTIIITLIGGLTLGLVCMQGTKLLDEEGNWTFGSNKSKTV